MARAGQELGASELQVQHFNCSATLNYDVKCKKILKFPRFDWLKSRVTLEITLQCKLFKKLHPFTRKGQGFFSTLSNLSYLIDPNSAVVPYLGLHGYSELMLLFLEPAFLRHFSAHVLSLNMHFKY